jgi:3-hydroxyacyl-CoA dehydrogenase
VQRCVYALVNEGAKIVEEGIAQRASDVDMVYLTGYGFPLHRGGPMHYAEEVGSARSRRGHAPIRLGTCQESRQMNEAVIVSTARTGSPRAGRALST